MRPEGVPSPTKWKDITAHKTADPKLKKKIAVISHQSREIPKLVEPEMLYAPVRRRLEVIKTSMHKDIGYDPQPNDLCTVECRSRMIVETYTRQTFFCSIEGNTFKLLLGLQTELDQYGYSITLYSFRHQAYCVQITLRASSNSFDHKRLRHQYSED